MEALEDSGLSDNYPQFGNYGPAGGRVVGRCALAPRGLTQMGAWMAIVACACAPVITLSVLMLRPLQPVAGVVAALG